MWHINSVFIFLLLNFLTIEICSAVIWEEEFNTPDLGVWGDDDGKSLHSNFNSENRWSITFDNCSFTAENDYVKTVSTAGGRLEALDCDGEAIWISEWIDISEYNEINCELTTKETGSSTKEEKKYLKAFFQVDNSGESLFEVNGINAGNWGETVASQSKIEGDSLRIIVRLNSSYAADKVILDAIHVWSDQPEFIDPNQLAKTGEILLNEILFNPYPEGVDFVELYNQSEKTIRLDHLLIATSDDNGELKTVVPLTNEKILFQPKTYLVLSKDQELVTAFYETTCPDCFLNLSKMPAWNNDEGRAILLNDSLTVIDEMAYSEKMHQPLLIDVEGVSLERISYERPAMESSNWTSASSMVNYATPGYQNSTAESTTSKNEFVELEPQTFSPNDDGYHDFLTINYAFNNPNYVATLKIFDSHGQAICDVVTNEPIGTEGHWTWNGKRNDGVKNPLGYYILLLELYDDSGHTKQFKKVCTITDRIE